MENPKQNETSVEELEELSLDDLKNVAGGSSGEQTEVVRTDSTSPTNPGPLPDN